MRYRFLAATLAAAVLPIPHSVQADSSFKVKIIAINDFHGNLRPPERFDLNDSTGKISLTAGGVARLAGYIRKLRAGYRHHVTVSAGDLIGASPLISANFQDEPTIEAMNLIGLDFNAVGNHEFDEGSDELLRMQRGGCHPRLTKEGRSCREPALSRKMRRHVGRKFAGASFRFLAANVRDRKLGKTLFSEYGIRQFQGRKIAFVGVTLKSTPNLVSPARVSELDFRDEADTVNALIPRLRAGGVEAVVVLIHEGGHPTVEASSDACGGVSGPIVDIVRRLDPEVDLVISGHTHEAYICRLPNAAGEPVLVTSAHDYGRMVSDIELTLDSKSGEVIAATGRNLVVNQPSQEAPPDPLVARLVADYSRLSRPIEEQRIGRITASFDRMANAAGESTLGDLIADAQLTATRPREHGEAVIAFMNIGGIRADFRYATERHGRISYREAFDAQPFGGTLVTMSLTGAQIEQVLEQQFPGCANSQPGSRILQVSSGFEYTWRANAGECDRVDPASIRLNGKPLEPEKKYRVTVNNFLADGGDKFSIFSQGSERVAGVPELTALRRYLDGHSPATPAPLTRIRRQP
ncbi:MAG: bifunctional metallophosphatase/5'-nucleotidase [Methylococcus sp.]|nr:bifunctional metallophosphatase/5'-nucleotidase [Methylococcus sp.]